ncbi:MAG: type II secretion system F family protein [Alphaproteobacteria bacterium]|nr:type II secretion system F family protein [Alphaproteobacteria bacterium]
MTEFRYVAVDPSSQTIEGRMEALTKSAVVERLHAAGHVPIRIDEIGLLTLQNMDVGELFTSRRVSRRSLALITGQLATLLHAGLALDESLGILADLIERPRERQALRTLREKISGGVTLADAMAAQPKVFPAFYVSMVRAGEAGASLESVLARLAEFLERSEAAKEHVKSALMYPLIVAVTCCVSIAVLMMFVVPRFRPLFEQAGSALPTSARLLLAASDLVNSFWWVGVLVPLLLVVVLASQFKSRASRARWERLFLRLPLVGDLIAKVEVVRFSRTLGTLMKNGVSLLAALAITRETIGNQVFVGAVSHVLEQVKTGKGLAVPLAQTKVFPPLAIHLIRVGEESGRQEEMLFKIADIFETETRRSIDRMLALLGPALTVVLGLVVADVIGSILTAILSVYDLAM